MSNELTCVFQLQDQLAATANKEFDPLGSLPHGWGKYHGAASVLEKYGKTFLGEKLPCLTRNQHIIFGIK